MNSYKSLNKIKLLIFSIAVVALIATLYLQVNYQIEYINIIASISYGIICSLLVWFLGALFSDNISYKIGKMHLFKENIEVYLNLLENYQLQVVGTNEFEIYGSMKSFNRMRMFCKICDCLCEITEFLTDYKKSIENLTSVSFNKIDELHNKKAKYKLTGKINLTSEMMNDIKLDIVMYKECLLEIKTALIKKEIGFYK